MGLSNDSYLRLVLAALAQMLTRITMASRASRVFQRDIYDMKRKEKRTQISSIFLSSEPQSWTHFQIFPSNFAAISGLRKSEFHTSSLDPIINSLRH